MNGPIIYLLAAVGVASMLYQADCQPKASPFSYFMVGAYWPVLGVLATYHTLVGEQVPRWGEGCKG